MIDCIIVDIDTCMYLCDTFVLYLYIFLVCHSFIACDISIELSSYTKREQEQLQSCQRNTAVPQWYLSLGCGLTESVYKM